VQAGRGIWSVASEALVDFLRNDKWGVASGTCKRDVAKAALVDFLRNDKWGVASETCKRDVAKAALVDFLRNDKWDVAYGTWRETWQVVNFKIIFIYYKKSLVFTL